MTQPNYINIGPAPNDGLGDDLRTSFGLANAWFSYLNSRVQTSPPTTLIGSPGDQPGMYAFDETYFYYCFADYDGSTVIWGQLASAGNISATQLINGTSSVDLAYSGNANITIAGVSNVAVFTPTGIKITGTVSASGNVTGTYFIGDGSQLTGLPSSYSNANVASYLPTYSGSLYPGAIYTNNYYYSNGQPFTGSGGGGSYNDSNVAAYLPTYGGSLGGTLSNPIQTNITQVGTLTELAVSGIHDIDFQAVASNIALYTTFGGAITITPSTTGSIDNMTIGANTAQSGRFTNVSSTGNVTATYFIGDGSLLTNVSGGTGNYSNANVAAYLPTYTGNIAGGNANITSNLAVGSTVTTNHITGQLTGTVNGINTSFGIWDFGNIDGVTFNTPIAYIFATTAAGNIDMGTIASPSSYNIDIGTIY